MRMKTKLLYILILIFSVLCVVSCAKTDNDNTDPVIGEVVLNPNDTINVAPGDTIRFNVDKDALIDTLVTKRRIIFSAHFSDDVALSSYKIYIDTAPGNIGTGQDTVYSYKNRWITIFDKKDYFFEDKANTDIYITDSLGYSAKSPITGKDTTLQKPIREGLYYMDIYCLDVAGNESSMRRIEFMLLNRQTIIDNR